MVYWLEGMLMRFLEVFLLWLFAPTLLVVMIAIILSLTPLKPPKTHNGWWKERDW
jgi:hypothetical protein